MTIHFICRGNVLRSLIAESYLKSLQLDGVHPQSSGTNVEHNDAMEHLYLRNTIKLLEEHGIVNYTKLAPHQLTQVRANNQDITICMNQRVIDEARAIVTMPAKIINWDITDIGEGERIGGEDKRETYEEEIYQQITAKVDELVRAHQLR